MLNRPPSAGRLRCLNRRQPKKLRVGEYRELVKNRPGAIPPRFGWRSARRDWRLRRSHPIKGFRTTICGYREKSRSADQSSATPCETQMAAMRAS